jgi:hypothetical protein
MKPKLDRIISIATLLAAVTAIVLVLKRPAPVVVHQAPTAVPANVQTFDQKPAAGEQASQTSQQSPQAMQTANVATASAVQMPAASAPTQAAKTDPHSDAISAVLAQSLSAATGGLSNLSPDSNVGSSAPNIKDQQVTMDGDVVHGRFLTEIGGKDVWVTVSGHMGEKDGFATFDPTEFKVGDVEVPVSLVNPLLQKKLEEERDRLKVPASQ